MNAAEAGLRKGTVVTYGLVVLSAAGAVCAAALAYSDTAGLYSDSTQSAPTTNGVFEDTWTTRPTTQPTTANQAPPGFNGTPLAPGYSAQTRSHGS